MKKKRERDGGKKRRPGLCFLCKKREGKHGGIKPGNHQTAEARQRAISPICKPQRWPKFPKKKLVGKRRSWGDPAMGRADKRAAKRGWPVNDHRKGGVNRRKQISRKKPAAPLRRSAHERRKTS